MRLAEGVTCSRIIARNGLTEITRLSITPTAKRNSYRVAILVETLPRVAGHARNPGLCNRNSYRVAAADGSPLPGPPQGAGVPTCCVLGGLNGSFPLGKVGMGPLCWPQKAPPQFPFLGKPERGLSLLSLSPWGELERGFGGSWERDFWASP